MVQGNTWPGSSHIQVSTYTLIDIYSEQMDSQLLTISTLCTCHNYTLSAIRPGPNTIYSREICYMEQELKSQFLHEGFAYTSQSLNMLNAAVVFVPGLTHTYSKYKQKQSNAVSKPRVLRETS